MISSNGIKGNKKSIKCGINVSRDTVVSLQFVAIPSSGFLNIVRNKCTHTHTHTHTHTRTLALEYRYYYVQSGTVRPKWSKMYTSLVLVLTGLQLKGECESVSHLL